MSFLKTLGKILATGTQIATGIGPIATAVAPQSAEGVSQGINEVTAIAGIITQVEAIGQTTGLDGQHKLIAATPLVANVLLKSPLLANHKIGDQTLYEAAAQKITGGFADLLNSLKDDSIKTENKT